MLKSNRILRNQQRLIEQLQQTNDLLQSLPERLGKFGGDVVIERFQVEQAHLDKLLFQLDHIDIKELSGTLNLGNNFQLEDVKKPNGEQKNSILHHLLNVKSSRLMPAEEQGDLNTSSDNPMEANDQQITTTDRGYAIRFV